MRHSVRTTFAAKTKGTAELNQHTRAGHIWSIVLADHDPDRVKLFVERWLGRHKPKPYCTFAGTRSMLQHTLDRATRLSRPEQVVTVVAREHAGEAWAHLTERSLGMVLFQPRTCETAAGIFLPLTYISARDEHATVVIHRSDHFVYPEDKYLEAVRRALAYADRLPDRPILLGAHPDRLELEYEWILPSLQLGQQEGHALYSVRGFLQNPTMAQADSALGSGAFWNTQVVVAKVQALWALGWRCWPDMMMLFERLRCLIGTSQEAKTLQDIYRDMPTQSFASGLLQQASEQLVVLEMNEVLWSDWGKPERILNTLRRIGRRPAFPLHCLDRPFAPLRPAEHAGSLAVCA